MVKANEQLTAGVRLAPEKGRYQIRLIKPNRTCVTFTTSNDRSEAIALGRRVHREISECEVLDTENSKVYRYTVERWVKPSTARVADAAGGDYFHDNPDAFKRMMLAINTESEEFSAEGC